MNRVEVNNRFAYETKEAVKIGDRVLLPTPQYLRDVKGPTWEGTVTALSSEYKGPCEKIIKVLTK